jgi:hypothetical protein
MEYAVRYCDPLQSVNAFVKSKLSKHQHLVESSVYIFHTSRCPNRLGKQQLQRRFGIQGDKASSGLEGVRVGV